MSTSKICNTHLGGLLQPFPIPHKIWKDIVIDFIIGLPNSKSYMVILVVVDRLSKFCHFIPLKGDFSSSTVVVAFINNLLKLHGVPRSIVTDRERVFLSNLLEISVSSNGYNSINVLLLSPSIRWSN